MARVRVASRAWWRQAAAVLWYPASLKIPMARMRRVAMTPVLPWCLPQSGGRAHACLNDVASDPLQRLATRQTQMYDHFASYEAVRWPLSRTYGNALTASAAGRGPLQHGEQPTQAWE